MTKFSMKSSAGSLSLEDKVFFGKYLTKDLTFFRPMFTSPLPLPPKTTRKSSDFFRSGVSRWCKMEIFARNKLCKNGLCFIHLTQSHFCYILVKLFEITSYLNLAKDLFIELRYPFQKFPLHYLSMNFEIPMSSPSQHLLIQSQQ